MRRMLKKMGYLSDSRGIINRYINTDGAWDRHLDNTRKFITDRIAGKKYKTLAVYGSGWLLDFPVDQVSREVGNIYLYDIVHPPQVKSKIKKYRNIHAVTADLTGGALTEAWTVVKDYKKHGMKPEIKAMFNNRFNPDPLPDYSISLNFLSQVGDIVTQYLAQHIPMEEHEINYLIGRLQQFHLDTLKPGKSCLITDVAEKYYDMHDKLQGSKEIIKCSLPLKGNCESWEWLFDPDGEYVRGLKTVSTVIAMEL